MLGVLMKPSNLGWWIVVSLLAVLAGQNSTAPALPPGIPAAVAARAEASPLREYFLPPTRVLWKSSEGGAQAEALPAAKPGQAVLSEPTPPTELKGAGAGVLLDFGVEVQGFVEIITPMMPDQAKLKTVRVRFGESASEAMAEPGGKQNAGNDHAVRDQVVTLPWLGKKRVGPSGFRFVDADGRETLDGMRFLDWPTFDNKRAVNEGLQAMLLLSMESGARLVGTLGDTTTAALCAETSTRLRRRVPEASGRKSPAALLALAGVRDAKDVADSVLKEGGPKDLSTFYGYYVLQALAKAKESDTALDFIRTYWGGMLDLGATTFWEGFDLEWMKDSGRIDELTPPGKRDVHGDCGEHCYVGFRHSLCHGWASGPTAWMSQHVLGIQPLEPGFKKVRVAPNLGRLQWAEGAYPTPLGPIRVRHERLADGTVVSEVKAPDGVDVVRVR